MRGPRVLISQPVTIPTSMAVIPNKALSVLLSDFLTYREKSALQYGMFLFLTSDKSVGQSFSSPSEKRTQTINNIVCTYLPVEFGAFITYMLDSQVLYATNNQIYYLPYSINCNLLFLTNSLLYSQSITGHETVELFKTITVMWLKQMLEK
jgi:hypothetical protein